jgi:radical SAM/Cys-rich protein
MRILKKEEYWGQAESCQTPPRDRFSETLQAIGQLPVHARSIDTLQVNLGYRCNLACKHCHVQAGPLRTEMMTRADIELVIAIVANSPIAVLDLTGGAPELHPDFRYLVTSARLAGCHVMVRSNLAIFSEHGQADLPGFYSENRVDVIASLPCYQAANVDAMRGRGTFVQCITALRCLNEHGYGGEDDRLKIHLVYNPSGAFLPPCQEALTSQYRKELLEHFGIRFNQLFTIANMPLGRFKEYLLHSGEHAAYLDALRQSFNPATLDGLMCRRLINVGWDGMLADCDFNATARIPLEEPAPRHLRDFDYEALCHRRIAVTEHCFGCTAGQGSSCNGAVAGVLPASL